MDAAEPSDGVPFNWPPPGRDVALMGGRGSCVRGEGGREQREERFLPTNKSLDGFGSMGGGVAILVVRNGVEQRWWQMPAGAACPARRTARMNEEETEEGGLRGKGKIPRFVADS